MRLTHKDEKQTRIELKILTNFRKLHYLKMRDVIKLKIKSYNQKIFLFLRKIVKKLSKLRLVDDKIGNPKKNFRSPFNFLKLIEI